MRRLLSLLLLATACSKPEEVVSSSCEGCHRPSTQVLGIEEQHPRFALRCVECHGGDPTVDSASEAHVMNPAPGTDLRALSRDALALADPDYRRFKNPGDPLVAPLTCGSGGPQGAQGCHQAVVEAAAFSLHATSAGLLNLSRYTAGLHPDRAARVAVNAATDLDYQPASAPPEAVAGLSALPFVPPVATPTRSDAARLYEHALSKACTGCHIGLYGAEGTGRPSGDFASGCTACHIYYSPDGLSQSEDPARDRSSKPHPVRHVLERSVPDEQCVRCHSRSLRVGLQYRGWRERREDETDIDLRNADLVEESLYGRPGRYFVRLENRAEAQDLTPPDVHHERGLSCADCHLGPDLHGDGFLRGGLRGAVGVRCQDCHGTFDAPAGADGRFVTSGGAPMPRLRREGDRVVLTGARDGLDHPVSQLVALRPSLALGEAHKTSSHGELECYACHTAWMQSAYALRRTLDLRAASDNPLDGAETPGQVVDTNAGLSLGDLVLGVNERGRLSPLMAQNALFDVIVPCNPANERPGVCSNSAEQPIFGKKLLSGWLPRTADGKRGLLWSPIFPHTTATRATVQPCERCHPRPFEVGEARVGATFGLGSGRFTAPDPAGGTIDLTQVIDASGELLVTLSHPSARGVPRAKIERALSYRVVPPLR